MQRVIDAQQRVIGQQQRVIDRQAALIGALERRGTDDDDSRRLETLARATLWRGKGQKNDGAR